MRVQLNQYEIQQALLELLQKRSTSKLRIVAFDLKGMRSDDGYHANVEFEYEDVEYGLDVPKVISFAKKDTTSNTTSQTEPVKKEETHLSEEALKQIQHVVGLLMDNVGNANKETIISYVDNSLPEVQDYFNEYAPYIQMLNEEVLVIEPDPESEELGSEETKEEHTEPETEKEATPEPNIAIVYDSEEAFNEANAAPPTNIFGVQTQPNSKTVAPAQPVSKPLFNFN